MSAIYRNGKWYGKDNGHIIMNNAGLELKPRATLQFGGDLSTTDDNTNECTLIKPHEISPEEWDDIVNLLPGGVSNNGIVIDTRGNEYIVGKYIESDGTIKPIYRRVLLGASLPANNTVLITDVSSVVNAYGRQFYTPSSCWYHFPYSLTLNSKIEEIRWEHYITDNTVRFKLSNVGTSTVTKYVFIFEYTKTTD